MRISDWSSDVCSSDLDALTERVLRISWRYLNQLGGVPERDDVRFNIAVSERDIPAADSPPDKGDYPRRDAARDEIGRAHVRTPVTTAPLGCRILLDKKK